MKCIVCLHRQSRDKESPVPSNGRAAATAFPLFFWLSRQLTEGLCQKHHINHSTLEWVHIPLVLQHSRDQHILQGPTHSDQHIQL